MLQRCHLRNSNFALITFRHDINLHGTTYTEAQIQRKAPHLVRLESKPISCEFSKSFKSTIIKKPLWMVHLS